KARILVNRRIEAVAALRVLPIDLGPGRRQKYAPMVAVGLTELFKHRLACPVLKAGSGIDQSSIEKYPTLRGDCRCPVGKSQRDRAPQKRRRVHPWQRQATA